MKLANAALIVGFSMVAPTTMAAQDHVALAVASTAQFGGQGDRRCHPRVAWTEGQRGGRGGQDLLVPGNINCIEAEIGVDLEVGVELCDGQPASLRGIRVHRESVTEDGRPRTFGANVYFQFVDARGRRAPRQAIIHSNRFREIAFPPQQVGQVVVGIAGQRNPAYPIYQRICSISFDMD